MTAATGTTGGRGGRPSDPEDASRYVRLRHSTFTGLPVMQAIELIRAAGFAHLVVWRRSDVPAVRLRHRVAILADRDGRVEQVGAF